MLDGKWLISGQPIPYPYQVCRILYSHTSACAEASAEALEELHG